MEKKRSILFTHDDLDGAGCRIVFDIAMQLREDKYVIYNCSNQNVSDVVMNEIDNYSLDSTIVYFADICPNTQVLQMLKDSGYTVEIYDHHPTNMFAMDYIKNALIIPSVDGRPESGTSLLFNNLFGLIPGKAEAYLNILELFVDTVRSYDTYEWKSTGNMKAKKLQILFFLLGMDRFCEGYIERAMYAINNMEPMETIPREYMIFIDSKLEQEQKSIDWFINNAKVASVDINGYKTAFYIGSTGANISELCHQYLNANPEYDMMMLYFPSSNEISIRSNREDFNTGEIICQPLGGGGHPKASGATLHEKLPAEIITLITECINSYYDK